MASFNMRLATNILALCLVLLGFDGMFVSSSGVFRGCYVIEPGNRHFELNPGDYDPFALTEEDCSRACAYHGYQYAALEEGLACFCAATDIEASAKVGDPTLCLGTCSVPGEHCGTATHGAIIYRASLSTSLAVSTSEVSTIIGQPVSIVFSSGVESDEKFSFGVDDGTEAVTEEGLGDTTLTHTFARPGSYLISVVARNSFTEDYGVIAVEVEAPELNPSSLNCPEIVSANETFQCVFNSVVAAAQYAAWTVDGDLVREVKYPDPFYVTRGWMPISLLSSVAAHVDPTGDVAWVIPAMDFTSPGWLNSVEVHVSKAGVLSLLVLRPICTTGDYCTVDNQCGLACVVDPAYPMSTAYQDTCLDSEVYCLFGSRCLSSVDTDTCPPPLQRYEMVGPSTPRSDYEVVHMVEITIPQVGRNFRSLSDEYQVEPGDVIGFAASPSSALVSFVAITEGTAEFEYGTAAVQGSTMGSDAASPHSKKHLLRVTAVESSPFKNTVPLSLPTLGNHTISVYLNSTSVQPSYSESARVLVCEQIQNLSIAASSSILDLNEVLTVSAWIDAGDSVQYTWDWGDGSTVDTQRQAMTFQDPDTETHSYSSYGSKLVTVTAENDCGTIVTKSVAVSVVGTEQPIQRHHYVISAVSPIEHPFPAEALFEFTFALSNPTAEVIGTNVTVQISTSYYENTTSDLYNLLIDGDATTVAHSVRFMGFHTARVTLRNPISEEVYFFPIESQEPLSPESSFQLMYILPVSSEGTLVRGLGEEQANFPVEYPIHFVPDISSGSDVQCQVVDYGDLSAPSPFFPATEMVSHQYSAPGQYEVTMTLVNSVTPTVIVRKTLHLYESISDINILEGPRTVAGMDKELSLGIASLGYQPCIVVEFDHGDQLEFYGNEMTCRTLTDYDAVGYGGPVTATLIHRYDDPGTKHVTVRAFNLVSNLEEDIFFYVGEGDCNSPNLYIRDGYRHFDGPRIVRRSDFTYLRGATYLECSFTGNTKYWSLANYNPADGSVIPGSEVNLALLGQGDPLFIDSGASLSELRIPPYHLPIGFYRFTHTVVMDNMVAEPVLAYVHDYMEVRRGPIRAEVILGPGTYMTLGQEQSLLLRPGELSRDLDLAADIQQEFDEFRYYCKRFYEDWPLDDNSMVASGYFTSENGIDSGGCFGEGAGRLNVTAPEYTLNGADLLVDMTYDILVEVVKDGRVGTRNLTILVVPGTIPLPFVEFEENVILEADGSVSLNPSEPLRLDLSCGSNCNGSEVQWSFQLFDGVEYTEITGWEEYATGNTSQELFLSDEFYAKFVPEGSSLRVSATMVSPSGDVGTIQFHAYVNPPPAGGTCTVSPLEINIGEDVLVSCTDWEDEHGIESYAFSAFGYSVDLDQTDLDQVDSEDSQLFFGRFPGASVTPPLGDPSNSDRLGLTAVITDTRGARRTHDLGIIQVHPGERLEDLLAFNETVSGEYESLHASQNTFEINRRLMVDASLLNQHRADSIIKMNTDLASLGVDPGDITDRGTESSPLEVPDEEISKIRQSRQKTRDTVAFFRTELIAVTAGAPVSSVDGVLMVTPAIRMLSHAPEELSHRFLNISSNLMLDMVGTMETVSPTEKNPKALTAIVQIVSVIGNLYQGSARSIDDPMDVIDQHEQSSDQSYPSLLNRLDQSSVTATQASNVERDAELLESKKKKAQETVNRLDECLERTMKLIFEHKQVNEPPTGLRYKSVSLTVARFAGSDLPGTHFREANGEYVIPPFCQMVSAEDCSGDPVNVQSLSLPDNPYNYVLSSEKLSEKSNVMSLTYKRPDGSVIPVEDSPSVIEIFVPRPSNDATDFVFYNASLPNNETGMTYHSFDVLYSDTSITIQLAPRNLSGGIYVVYLRYEGYPSPEAYDHRFFLPGNESSLDEVAVDKSPDGAQAWAYKIFLDNTVVSNWTGKYTVGISQVPATFWEDSGPIYFEQALDWFIGNASVNGTDPYQLSLSVSGCSFWIPELQTWGSNGCVVGLKTDAARTQCLCNHLTSFASTWIVPPAPLDFEYIFANLSFAQNMTIYIATITAYTVFTFLFIWARRKDKKDTLLLGVTPLMDNKPAHKYLYEMSVLTGQRSGAGTDSKVSFIISGDQDETEDRTLEDDKRKILDRGGIDRFLLSVERPLGTLNYMRIWHDNSGQGDRQGWYLKYVAIRDLQTKERFYFIVNRWFSVVEDDGQVDRLVAVAGKEQMKEFSHVFEGHTSKNLNDGHLWISIVGRPVTSRFTRAQRVGCCMMALWLEMLVNIMWYKTLPPPHSAQAFNIGPISMSPAQISIGIQSMILVFPVTLLVVQFFRKSKPRRKRESRIKRAQKEQWERYRVSSPTGSRPKLPPNSRILQERRTYGQGPAGGTRADPRLVHDDLDLDDPMRGNDGRYHHLKAEVDTRVSSPAPVKQTPKSPPFMFPWWFIVVAWILLILTTAASTLFTVFYGIQMGDIETREWLASELVSFFTGVFIAQPIKVVLIAMLITCLFRSPNVDEEPDAEVDEETYDKSLDTDEEWLHDLPAGPSKERKIKAKPPTPENLERIRERRMKELQIYSVLKDIFFYFIFLFTLMVVSYGNLDTWSYTYKQNLENVLVVGDNIHAFTKIKTKEQVWTWVKLILVPSLEGTELYNGDEDNSLKKHMSDQTSLILGYPVLRQLRVKPNLCEPHNSFENILDECNKEYSFLNEDEESYSVGWTPYNETTARPEYKYTEAEMLDGYPYYAKHALYSGGGYVAKLKGNQRAIMHKVDRLLSEKWLDVYSRALFIEMSLYNPQVNLFGVVNLVVEFLPTGGAHPMARIDVVRLITVDQAFGAVYIGCLVIFLCFIVFNLGKQLLAMRKQKREYYKSFWNLCDLSTVGFSVAACVIFFYRMSVTNDLLERFRETHGHAYIKLQYVAYWNELLGYMLGWLIYICTLKFLKLLKFNRRIGLLSSTIRTCSTDLLYFAMLFCIFFFAFAIAFYLILNTIVYNYSDFIYTSETLVSAILGKFHFKELVDANRTLGPLFFFLFMGTITFILINMFLTIINEAFSSVKHDLTKQSNEYEVVDFMVGRMKTFFGLASKSNVVEDKKRKSLSEETDAKDPMEEFPDKVDRLLDSISSLYFDQEKFADVMRSMEKEGRRKRKRAFISN